MKLEKHADMRNAEIMALGEVINVLNGVKNFMRVNKISNDMLNTYIQEVILRKSDRRNCLRAVVSAIGKSTKKLHDVERLDKKGWNE